MKGSNKLLLLTLLSASILNAGDVVLSSSVEGGVKEGDVYTREHTIENNTTSNVLVDMVFKMQNQEPFSLPKSSLNSGKSLSIKDVKLAKSAGDKDETYQLSAISYDLTNKTTVLNDNFSTNTDWGDKCIIENGEATTTYNTTSGSGICTKTIDIEQDKAYSINLKAKVEKSSNAAANAFVSLAYVDNNGTLLSKNYNSQIVSSSLEDINLYIPKAPNGATKLKINILTAQDKSVTFDDVEVSSYTINSQVEVNETSNLTYTIATNNSARSTTASLSGIIWYDKNVNGIQDYSEWGVEDVKVHLLKDGVDTGEYNITDENGMYLFDNLEADHNYSIKVDIPDSFKSFTYKNRGSDESLDSDVDGYGYSDSVYLRAGDEYKDLAAGMVCRCLAWIDIEKYTIDRDGNRVDADYLKDAPKLIVGKPVTWVYVIKNTSNVEIENISVDDDKEGHICDIDSLDYNETYECNKTGVVTEGNYTNMATVSGVGENGQDVGEEDPSNYIGVKPSCIGDFVWLDKNKNGIQDANESGIAGAKVELLDENGTQAKDIDGNLVAPITTTSNGEYKFCNLDEGKYIIKVTPPNGYDITSQDQGGDDSKDSDIDQNTWKSNTINLELGKDDLDIDCGVTKKTSCLGDFIWLDSNKNGIQDANESGIAGAIVELLDQNGSQAKDIDGNLVTPITTTSNGEYKFCNLDEGKYIIKLTPPSGYTYTIDNVGGDDSKDSDFNKTSGKTTTINLGSGENDMSWDGGLVQLKKPSCLGDYIWEDKNKNGIQDANESGIAGAKVELLDENGNQAKDIDGNLVAPITTTSNGEYKFCNLDEGKYIIKVTPPSGYDITLPNQGSDDTKDSDIDQITGKTAVITLDSGENDMSWDGGVTPNEDTNPDDHTGTACLGNYVWLDENLNGIQDSNEVGVVDVKVELYDANTNTLLATTKTDSSGKYEFCKLKPGKYKVKFEQPNTYLFTYKDKGSDLTDSDVDKSGWSHIVELEAGEKDMSIDAGIYCECDDYKVNPQNYKKLSAAISLNSAFALLLFVIFATSTLKYKRD